MSGSQNWEIYLVKRDSSQGPLERRPCSPSTNCTAPGPRTAARADRRTGERAGERGPGASWALGAGARARSFQNIGYFIIIN